MLSDNNVTFARSAGGRIIKYRIAPSIDESGSESGMSGVWRSCNQGLADVLPTG
jgi:hypothetical protein